MTPTDEVTGTPTTGADAARDDRGWRWAAWALVVLPFLTAAARAIRRDWLPIGDSAQLYLRARDVLDPDHHPWLGAWSSASLSVGEHLNNPGPAYFDLIAPFARAFDPGTGHVLGVTAVNVACAIGAALAARRIGGRGYELAILVAASALAWTMGSELLFDMFQGHSLLFPFLFGLVLVSGALVGASWVWPWLVAVFSVIVQTHISYVYVTALAATVVAGVTIARLPAPRRIAATAAARSPAVRRSALVLAVVWLQPVLEQMFGRGRGNLARLVANAGDGDVTVGFATAAKLTSAVYALPPWWTRTGFTGTIRATPLTPTGEGPRLALAGLPGPAVTLLSLAATAGLLGVALGRARRTGRDVLAALAGLSLAGLAGSVVALGRLLVGPVGFAPHHTRWLFVLALLAHVTLVWSLLALVADRLAARDRRPGRAPTTAGAATVLATAAVAAFAVANLGYFAQPHGPTADAGAMPAVRRLLPALDALRGFGPVRYRTDNLRLAEPYSSAVQVQLQARGIEFRVDGEIVVRHLGDGRRADGTEPVTLTQYEAWAAFGYDGPGCVLARAGALGPRAERELLDRAESLAGEVAGALDVSRVVTSPRAAEVDRALATGFTAGETATIREVTYDGRLRAWIELGLIDGDPAVIDRVRREGPAITAWLDSTVALVVTPAGPCAGR